jgi:hypothetical protein
VKSPDGKYHMYVSRFPKSLPFHPRWMVASEIVHAVSDKIQGPYTFSDVALPAHKAEAACRLPPSKAPYWLFPIFCRKR